MRRRKIKEKISLHPVMTYLILCLIVIVVSGILSWFNVQATYNQISSTTGEYTAKTEVVRSLLSLSGLKYIFTSTVASFANFTVLSNLIIILLGIGVMEKTGFLKTVITLLTKKAKKTTVTFWLVFICIVTSIIGDLSYIIFIPLSALLFLYGKLNPLLGIITAFAALTCGSGLSLLLTSVDSSLAKVSVLNANIITSSYGIHTTSFIYIMLVAIILVSFLITGITENIVAKRLDKYSFAEENVEEEIVTTHNKTRGLLLAIIVGTIYLIIFIYNIIPGLPFSGNLLDYSQELYIDKLFSYESFFRNGFVFIVAVFFVLLGLSYGIGAKTIKNDKDFVDSLGHSLNGIGKILVMIFAAATFINIIKQSNIGNVVTVALTNLLGRTSFSGLPLLIMLYLITIVATIFLPNSLSKWSIIATMAVPLLVNAGITPGFAQVVFRFGESITMGLTPIFAYFVVYLAYLEKYSQHKNISLFKALKFQVPYTSLVFVSFLVIFVLWYIIGIPLGINSPIAL